MKFVYVLATLTSMLFAEKLTFLSSDTSSSQKLFSKYRQDLFIAENNIYLIPTSCTLKRGFGGASQGELQLTKAPVQTEKLIITEEIFEADSTDELAKEIESKKSVQLILGKKAEEFLADNEGRGFGGFSQNPLNLDKQKESHVISKKESKQQKETFECHLMDNGLGYTINASGKIYTKDGIIEIKEQQVLFQ